METQIEDAVVLITLAELNRAFALAKHREARELGGIMEELVNTVSRS
jgi:hypothetical protein